MRALSIIMCMLLVGCVLRPVTNPNNPAQQTNRSTLITTESTPIPITTIDQDGDGTLSATERQSLIGDQPGVLPTFSMIIGLVLFASIASAWASSKWSPKKHPPTRDTDDQTG